MFNQAVQLTFSLAVREAQRRHHEFLTSEHVLFAMLFDESAQEILRSCGGDTEVMESQLEDYFNRHLETLPEEAEAVPEQTAWPAAHSAADGDAHAGRGQKGDHRRGCAGRDS